MKRVSKYAIGMSGEHRVCSELLRKGVMPYLSFGNNKQADIIVLNSKKALKIEVKTGTTNRILTGYYQKPINFTNRQSLDSIWVLCYYPETGEDVRFFILTESEIRDEQYKRNCQSKTVDWKMNNPKNKPMKGRDNLDIRQLDRYENAWEKIVG